MPKGVKLSNKSEFRHKHALGYMCYHTVVVPGQLGNLFWGEGVSRNISSAGSEQHWPNELMIPCKTAGSNAPVFVFPLFGK